MSGFFLWPPIVAAISGATATALIGYLATGGRIRKIAERVKSCGKCVWAHTNIVLYVSIVVTVSVSYWQIHQLNQEAVQVRAGLCLLQGKARAELKDTEFQLRHARELSLPPPSILQLQLTIAGDKATIRSFRDLRC